MSSRNDVSLKSTALVADIGGTNARFALTVDDQLQTETIQVLACNDFENLDGAVRQYLDQQNATVDEACMAFACPVANGSVNMTNNHWAFERSAMQQKLGLKSFKIINDFTAQALALPALEESDLIKVGAGEGMDDAARLIIGPGTGLGVAGLKPVAEDWLPLPGEGGHAAYSPVSEMDQQILARLLRKQPFISWETVLCGSGLELLYKTHSTLLGENNVLRDFEITEQALAGETVAKRVLNHFCELLGRAASDSALTLGAQGGVYIAGGIIPRFPEFFAESGFRRAFEINDKMTGYVKAIPTYLVTAENPGLIGACAALHNPLV